MKLIVIISFLLNCLVTLGQTFVIPANYRDLTPPGERMLVNEIFTGSSLSTDFSVRNGSGMTITVAGGEAHIVGSGTTKDFRYMFRDTAYGYSQMRNYKVEMKFRIGATSADANGIFVGVYSPYVSDYRFSTYGVVDFSDATDTLAVCASNDTIFFSQPASRKTTGLPAFNTSDNYKLRLEVFEGTATVWIVNITTGDSTSQALTYEFNTSGIWPLRPNFFHYTFGVMGSTDIYADYFRVTTAEVLYPKNLYVGNSITSGYTAGGNGQNSFAYKLRDYYTQDSVRILAGAGNRITDLQLCTKEIINESLSGYTNIFLNIGTNAGGTTTDYQNLVTTFTNAGLTVRPSLLVNGGDPTNPVTWNYFIKNTYPSTYIDLYTYGWSTMSTSNNEMADAIHPNNKGMLKIANLHKYYVPSLYGQERINWAGRSAVICGDSYVLGVGASDNSKRWSTLFCGAKGTTEINNGVSGQTMQANGCGGSTFSNTVIPTYNAATHSILIIALGVNDVGLNKSDNSMDTASYGTKYRSDLANAISKGWPAHLIWIITPYVPYSYSGWLGFGGCTINIADNTRNQNFRLSCVQSAATIAANTVDIGKFMENTFTVSDYNGDGIHVNDAGHQKIADFLIALIN